MGEETGLGVRGEKGWPGGAGPVGVRGPSLPLPGSSPGDMGGSPAGDAGRSDGDTGCSAGDTGCSEGDTGCSAGDLGGSSL